MALIEEQISKAVKEAVESIPVENKEVVRANIKNELEKYKRRQNWRKRAISIAVIAFIFISGVLVGTGNQSTADAWFFKSAKSFIEDILNVSGHGTQENAEQKDETETVNILSPKDLVTFEEASQIVSYNITLPHYVPNGYEFKGIFIGDINHKSSMVEVNYVNEKNDFIIISQYPVKKGSSFSHSIRTTNAEITTTVINGYEATIINYPDRVLIAWQTHNMYYTIFGPIDNKEEIVAMAKSIR